MGFLPINLKEINGLGRNEPDFIIVTGDAYIDHPSFGAAIIGRILENAGFVVGIIPQPNWKDINSFKIFGRPRLGFLVTGGNIDSMVNHYSVAKKKRQKDLYSPNGQIGLRPDRATIVYGNKIREAYKDIPIIIGGLEASLRRLSHYDYWDNKVRRSILLDSSADILVYGMGETQIIEIAKALDAQIPLYEINFIRGCVYKSRNKPELLDYMELPSYKAVLSDKSAYAKSFKMQYENTDSITAKTLIEMYDDYYIVQNPPAKPLTTPQLDKIYSLHFMRNYHPIYEKLGGVPAITEIKFSIISNRGCFGACNFCSIAFHQGRVVQARSHKSIINEAEKFTWDSEFKGYIHDVGGPTANFRIPSCEKQLTQGVCKNKQCLFPKPCNKLQVSHEDYIKLLRKLRDIPKVKKVFIRSGIRMDYIMADKKDTFINELCEHHVSGQLKVAPEHVSSKVLRIMGKPTVDVYNSFKKKFDTINTKLGLKQYLVPYLLSSHPGCDLNDAVELAEYLRDTKTTPQQVQDFYPTPGTLSTCMYYTELNPLTLEKIYVPKNPHEKALQRALMQYKLPQNYSLVLEALMKTGRKDLIGFDKKCLIRPRNTYKRY